MMKKISEDDYQQALSSWQKMPNTSKKERKGKNNYTVKFFVNGEEFLICKSIRKPKFGQIGADYSKEYRINTNIKPL